MTPDLLLRRSDVVKSSPDDFQVLLPLPDGYELQVGGVSKQTGANRRAFWQWSVPGRAGQSETLEEAKIALKAAWNATDTDLAVMRRQQESTEWKYALWDAGYRSQMANDQIRCRCGAMFAPDDHEAVRVHIQHIRPPR